jgi:hypothetical protein
MIEDNIATSLDNLDYYQTDKLLEKDFNMSIDIRKIKRIKAVVFKKIGLKKYIHLYKNKKLVAFAATFFIVVVSIFSLGFDNVSATIGKLFSFIPGYSVIENNTTIEYFNSDIASVENDNVILSLRNVVATKNEISAFLTIRAKSILNEQNIDKTQEAKKFIQNNIDLTNFYLYINKNKYPTNAKITSSSPGDVNVFVNFKVKPEEINSEQTFKLVNSDYTLNVSFKLKPISGYNSLEEIGSTDYNNKISITAVPTLKDGKLVVDLYPINKSNYQILSFSKYYGFMEKDLYLQTNKGVKTYITSSFPDGMSAPNTRYTFDLNDNSKDFILKIPYIVVQNSEQNNISIQIPKMDQSLTLNQKVEFADSYLIIKKVQRKSNVGDIKDVLKVDVEYKNKYPNKKMFKVEFENVDFWGNIKSGGYSSELNGDGIETTEYFPLEKDENGSIRLKVLNPKYVLLGEYSLELSP